MRSRHALTLLGFALVATHCAVSFHDYPVGDLDASFAGSAGASGNGGSAGGDASGADAGRCPALAGPTMVEVPAPAGGQSYCIDSTEVTNAEYQKFLAAKPAMSIQPTYCSFNTTFTPEGGWPATGKDDYPVVYVNWCDAYAFCAWAGKRLCGRIGGGAVAYADYNDASKSQWFNACSAGGTKLYPYGNAFIQGACNGNAVVSSVGQWSACVGGYAGIHDMSGNVWEWEDNCQSGVTGFCRDRGGSAANPASANLRCDTGVAAVDRNSSSPFIGFRCCWP